MLTGRKEKFQSQSVLILVIDGPYPMSFESSGIDAFNCRDEVEVDVSGNEFLDPLINQGGGVEGVPCFNLGVGFQYF
jgi:hypothetical protein